MTSSVHAKDAPENVLADEESATILKDLTITLQDRPGALAEMGEALGRAGVSVEGLGSFVVGSPG